MTLLVLAFVFGNGCDNASCGVCTDEYRSYGVTVIDATGNPVEGLTATVRNEWSGRSISRDSTNGGLGIGGNYTLITDSEIDMVSEDGSPISFVAAGNNLVAEASYVIGTGNCRCHVLKISGPDTITAR